MKGIILAAGRGSRLGDISEGKPKCMISLNQKPLINYQIDSMLNNGISDIAVVTGYLKNKVKHEKITKIYENKIWSETNMVYSLLMADEWLSNFECIVSYGDIFYPPSAVSDLCKSSNHISVLYDINFKALWSKRFDNPLEDLETFIINHSKHLTEIGNKPKNYHEIMGQFMGLLKITPNGWNDIKLHISKSKMKKIDVTKMLSLMIEKKYIIAGVEFNGIWGEIDIPSDIKLYEGQNE